MTLNRSQLVVGFCLVALLANVIAAYGKGTSPGYLISNIVQGQTAEEHLLLIRGSSPPTYTMFELFDPLRIIVDIANAGFAANVPLPLQVADGPFSKVSGKRLEEKEPIVARVEIFLQGDHPYSIERVGNDIRIAFKKDDTRSPQTTDKAAALLPPPYSPPSSAAPAQPATPSSTVEAVDTDRSFASVIEAIEVTPGPITTSVFIRTDGAVDGYTPVELKKDGGKPDRLYIDVSGVAALDLPTQKKVGTAALKQVRTSRRQTGMRVVFDSNQDGLFSYKITSLPNGLKVDIQEPSGMPPVMTTQEEEVAKASSPVIQPSFEQGSPEKSKAISAPAPSSKPSSAQPGDKAPGEDNYAFSGYEKQRITVDFYKIDLHNVFRLFGEISGMNIVVDEKVSGTLTLALKNVPWDFALDIVMNLKDLQKEERLNTIVISPKSKALIWPKGGTTDLAFKANETVQMEEQLSVEQRHAPSKAETEMQKLVLAAQTKEKEGDLTMALSHYEDAFAKIPTNIQLAKRISSFCLVRLGMNAKALYYAQQALKGDPTDQNAALNAAIGLANMQNFAEAHSYFERATSGNKPSDEALLSYAVFLEQNQDADTALLLYEKHRVLYGDTLDTMVARARIYDKLGRDGAAIAEYRAVLLSGFAIPPDLKRYINGRLAVYNEKDPISEKVLQPETVN